MWYALAFIIGVAVGALGMIGYMTLECMRSWH